MLPDMSLLAPCIPRSASLGGRRASRNVDVQPVIISLPTSSWAAPVWVLSFLRPGFDIRYFIVLRTTVVPSGTFHRDFPYQKSPKTRSSSVSRSRALSPLCRPRPSSPTGFDDRRRTATLFRFELDVSGFFNSISTRARRPVYVMGHRTLGMFKFVCNLERSRSAFFFFHCNRPCGQKGDEDHGVGFSQALPPARFLFFALSLILLLLTSSPLSYTTRKAYHGCVMSPDHTQHHD